MNIYHFYRKETAPHRYEQNNHDDKLTSANVTQSLKPGKNSQIDSKTNSILIGGHGTDPSKQRSVEKKFTPLTGRPAHCAR